MSIPQEYSIHSNATRSKTVGYRVLNSATGDRPTDVGYEVAWVRTWQAMKLPAAGKQTHSAVGTISFTGHWLGHYSPWSSARRDTCTVTAHAGYDAIAQSRTTDQRPLVGRQISVSGIEPAGLGANLCLGPAKVAKIKADADASPMAGLEMQVAPTILAVRRRQFFLTTAANDNHVRIAA